MEFHDPQVILFSDDLPRAVRFYQRLGFEQTFRTPPDGDPIHVDLRLGGYTIGIATGESSRSDHGLDPVVSGQRATVVVWCDDVDAAYAALVAEGVVSLKAPHPFLGRLRIAWLSDPDGNPVQLAQSLR